MKRNTDRFENRKLNRHTKNESRGDVKAMAYDWFANAYSDADPEDYWVQAAGGVLEFLELVANYDADPVIDECISDLNLDDEAHDDVADGLAEAADEMLNDPDYYNPDDEDEYDESFKCSRVALESRIHRLERLLYKTEASGTSNVLPNGRIAGHVSDVLAGWANCYGLDEDVAKRRVISKLKRKGVLDNATNRWYPFPDDVELAVDDCWNDIISPTGNGEAKLFMSTSGDIALTLYPRVGTNSRSRQCTLKFHWDVE